MDKLKMQSKNLVDENIEKIKALFPNCVTEARNDNGVLVNMIDFDLLKQELSHIVVEGEQERYMMTWPDKKQAILTANTPINKTLRPCVEESVGKDGKDGGFDSENLYIEGDNLEVLKLLRETYLGKVDVIYIDPPYNTGNDILYINDYSIKQDEFSGKYEVDENGNRMYINTDSNGRFHTDWMNMMYQRIKVSKELLAPNGFFLIAIDHNELFNIGEICDEIFGYSNRIGIISVVHKPEGRNQAKFIGPSNEFMLIYAKNESVAKLQKVALSEEQSKAFECEDEKGAFRLKNFIRLSDGKYATRENKPTFWYPIYVNNDLTQLSLDEFENGFVVYPVTEQGIERTWKTTRETFIERYKNGDIVAKKENGKIIIYEKLREDQVIKTHWIEKKYHGFHFGTKILDDLLGVKTFDFPKSLFLMRDIIKLFAKKDALILDFFSGSATTAHAVNLVNTEDGGNRHFILVQMPALCDEKSEAFKAGYKNICEIGKERIRRAGKKIKEETNADIDYGFRVLKLDSSCMKDVFYTPNDYNQTLLTNLESNIKEDRTPEDLLFQVMLEMGVLLSGEIKITEIAGKKIFNVNNGNLICCFDENITDEVVIEIAKLEPPYAVFRDKSLKNDSVSVNFDQIFETYHPNTKRKVL